MIGFRKVTIGPTGPIDLSSVFGHYVLVLLHMPAPPLSQARMWRKDGLHFSSPSRPKLTEDEVSQLANQFSESMVGQE